MELAVPYGPRTTWLSRKPPQVPRLNRFNPSKHRSRKPTSSELQTTLGVVATGSAGGGGSHSPSIPTHKVTVHDRQRGVVHEFIVPEGYALLCVGFPSSDLEVETQDEDEVYWLQFGRYFARGPIDRDDYALELAMGDE
ncbi:Phenol hydroxylase reductase [Parasponia andersonii]|uniref:Phenol hydroxylase reductase n=1 Tax=Parasponia andersonii TaxID=3476 RepID=A0A2P5C7T0_PARAD|nr:Phenol hydroxylase reductase [Parasponia andersonii]